MFLRAKNPRQAAFRLPLVDLHRSSCGHDRSRNAQSGTISKVTSRHLRCTDLLAMDDRVPRAHLRIVAVMVILMWWSYFEVIRPVMLPPRHEQRQVFPPGALDPNSTYKHLRDPRARYEPDRIPLAGAERQTSQVS